MSLLLLGCATNDIDYTLARMAGNKQATFFAFDSVEEVNKWSFETKDYKALPPQTYKKDWELMSPWNGAYIYGGISFGIENQDEFEVGGTYVGYGINMTSSVWKYEKREREIEANNVQYMRKLIRWLKPSDILTIEHHGKENYPCVVIEMGYSDRGVKKKSYDCYKFNQERTLAKRVLVDLIYTKSQKSPEQYKYLIQEYTYEDLQQRAKRVLDSLYIKDGWKKQ